MAAGAAKMLHVWKEWGLQTLVLLSLTFQIVLLMLAEFRRSVDSGVLRSSLWSAYILADTTAIYILGHLSATDRSPEHDLMAFWAPFLLLHLGGQDNITAYAIEDNRLWLRHLQTLAVQVAAAAYVLYPSPIFEHSVLRRATILMFVAGAAKYGERVWALMSVGRNPLGSNYRSLERLMYRIRLPHRVATGITGSLDTEAFLLLAHQLLSVPKDLFLERVSTEGLTTTLTGEQAYKVAEMQLSLMHDIFYTKTEVMHTWYGICIRLTALLASAIALLQFHRLVMSDRKGLQYSAGDIAVTYVLLAGAVILEITSALRFVFSSWTWSLLVGWASLEPRNLCFFLVRGNLALRWLVGSSERRRRRSWSRSMGQHNILTLCARSKTSRCSKIARWMGFEDPWNRLWYSGSIPVTAFIEHLLVAQVRKNGYRWSPDHIVSSQVRKELEAWGLYDDLDWSLEESILVWHIATDLYLYWYREEEQKATGLHKDAQADVAKAVEALSNYMLFLLVARPYMLPPPAGGNAYVQMCYALLPSREKERNYSMPALDQGYNSAKDLAKLLREMGESVDTGPTTNPIISVIGRGDSEMAITASKLGAKLISCDQSEGSSTGSRLEFIVELWVEMLLYVACRCSAYSHAKQLSNGGELVTVAALLVRYISGGMTSEPSDDEP